ncbi:MAG TPA: hypothetical protein VJV78_06870 [Polyangiales bacterium]|nr:hypothetical protein [Polyangiales bacterium]
MWIAAAALLAACTDPGCIRNSECGSGYVCLQHACVVDTDAATSITEDDAGKEK